MYGITLQPPSMTIEIRYEYYQMAYDKAFGGGPASAYPDVNYQMSLFHNAVLELMYRYVLMHTPIASGQLKRSIEVFARQRKGPEESLPWKWWDSALQQWVPETRTMPRYYYEIFVCYSNAYYMGGQDMSYAMPVETGTPILYNTHYIPPVQRLRQWVSHTWGSDPSFVWKLQALIKSRGTPVYAMFWNGFVDMTISGLDQASTLLSRDYWTVNESDYHLELTSK